MGDDIGWCHECYRWYGGPWWNAWCLEVDQSEGGLREFCRPLPRACGRRCEVRSGFWPCSYGCDLVKNHEGVHTCLYHLGSGPAPTPIDERDRVRGMDRDGANASYSGEVLRDEVKVMKISGSVQGRKSLQPEVGFCRTTGAHADLCRRCRGSDGLEVAFSLANVRVNGVCIAADVRVNGVSAAGGVRVNGALAGNISEDDVVQMVNEDDSISEFGMPSVKEKDVMLQDTQCPAVCGSLSRDGPGRICGGRCCLSYGHICTHRCMDHWGWNLEVMKVYSTKNADYIDIFAGTDVETKEVVITMLGDGYVRENCKNVDGINEKIEDYRMKYLKGKMAMDVIDKYVGFSDSGSCAQEESRISPRRESSPVGTLRWSGRRGIYNVSQDGEKKEKNAEETDLCEPIHIAIKDFEARHRDLKWLVDIPVEVRKDCDIQLESVTGEYT